MSQRQWTFNGEIDWLGRPIAANVWYSKHHIPKAALVKEWRDAGASLAMLNRFPRGIVFEVELQARYERNQLTDFDAMAPTAKAVVDGFIDYGLAPDDSGAYCRGLILRPSFHSKVLGDALLVTVREVLPGE